MPRMGNPSIQKIMFAHIALLGFQRAGGRTAVFFVTSITLHRLHAFASNHGDFSHHIVFSTDNSDPALRRQSSVPRMTFTT